MLGGEPLAFMSDPAPAVLVLFVVAAPEGIIGLIRKLRRDRNEGEA